MMTGAFYTFACMHFQFNCFAPSLWTIGVLCSPPVPMITPLSRARLSKWTSLLPRAAKKNPVEWKYTLTEPPTRMQVSELKVGQSYQGKVIDRYHDKCLYVDIGAKLPGMVTFAECQDGFPTRGFAANKGDSVDVRVLDIEGDKFYLTMRSGDLERPPRERIVNDDLSPFRKMTTKDWMEGEVSAIFAWGVFVKVTDPDGNVAIGMLHKKAFKPEFVREAIRGGKVKVRVESVKMDQLTLSMQEV